MQRSRILLRGTKSYGWYNDYRQHPEEFAKYTSPKPFDWSKPAVIRPKAYFDISCGGESWGRMTFELAQDVLPKTVANFKLLTSGENKHKRWYKNTKIHRVRKGEYLMAGDVETNTGELSHSAYDARFLLDENFIIPHSARGLLSMASVGVNTNGSQFYISLSPTQYMNGRCSVIGRLIEGEAVLSKIESVFTHKFVPSNDIVISECSVIEADTGKQG